MTIAVTGIRTTIVEALRELLPANEEVVRIDADLADMGCSVGYPASADRFVLAAGLLRSKRLVEQSAEEIAESLAVNLISVVRICESVLAANSNARICIMGSESGFKGSYDETYAMAKAALHRYVETRKVGPKQQIVAVAPHIIADSGMTERRPDYRECIERGLDSTKGRWIWASEVAATIHHLLYADAGFINNTVIRMHGGLA